MKSFRLSNLQFETPDDWGDVCQISFILPSPVPHVKPNIIVTREKLDRPIPLTVYFARVKDQVAKQGISDLQIIEEGTIEVGGVRALTITYSWNVNNLKQLLAGAAEEVQQTSQPITQVYVSLIREQVAINLTSSFPTVHISLLRPLLERFLSTMQFI